MWTQPEKNPELTNARKANRVLTVMQLAMKPAQAKPFDLEHAKIRDEVFR